jgi:hypothetical protein
LHAVTALRATQVAREAGDAALKKIMQAVVGERSGRLLRCVRRRSNQFDCSKDRVVRKRLRKRKRRYRVVLVWVGDGGPKSRRGNSSVVERWIPVPAVVGSIPSSLIFFFQVSWILASISWNTGLLHVPSRDVKSAILLDLCVSSLRRGHANLLCIVPIFTDDHRSGS